MKFLSLFFAYVFLFSAVQAVDAQTVTATPSATTTESPTPTVTVTPPATTPTSTATVVPTSASSSSTAPTSGSKKKKEVLGAATKLGSTGFERDVLPWAIGGVAGMVLFFFGFRMMRSNGKDE